MHVLPQGYACTRPEPLLSRKHNRSLIFCLFRTHHTDAILPCSIPLAFSRLTPLQVCEAFSRALNRPCRYVRGPITFHVPVPAGYREHLEILEETLGWQCAPYFGPDLEEDCTRKALDLWEGFRDIEEYAREIFPVEERANGLTWMDEDDTDTQPDDTPSETPIRDVENFFQVMNL